MDNNEILLYVIVVPILILVFAYLWARYKDKKK